MSLISGLAIYFIIWWLCLFITLPFGARSAHEAGEVIEAGHAPSAPIKAHMGRKLIATTIMAFVFFGFFYWLIPGGHLSFSDLWFFPDFTPKL
jgi:predicted secreted protein